MFEFALTFLVFVLVFYVGNYWLSLIATAILLVLVLPGLYAMFRGAPFIPSSDKKLVRMMKLVDFDEVDVVYDLGCGDGKVIREVASRGVKKAVGIEFSVPTYWWARMKRFLKKSKEELRFGNFWKQDYGDADVLICFLLEKTMEDFAKTIWPKLKKGVRVISNEFPMKGVEADESDGRVYLYVRK